MTVYQFEAKKINGETISLSEFKGEVLLIVNTASNCGFTPQYKELQELYEQYKEKGFTVLGFPCNQFMNQEPGTESDIQSFCEMNFGVTFPLFSKVDVNGKNAHPLFQYLTEEAPGVLGMKAVKWNFTKFLVNRSGEVVERYAPNTNPKEISQDIEKLI
ncbi:glutathione peroxidase [Robertmurraya sp. FSL R5-0851]|uniref:glutathione peroxidase n=1 Tax=Robertmurraya sp. FSL R5-0851 TaxID=2921584 RepID=UPI000927B0EF|nr:glutathione peroxidase [Mycobacteroides abscessus subsp. abscessus]